MVSIPDTSKQALSLPTRDRLGNVRSYARRNWRPLTLLALSLVLVLVYLIGRPYILYDDGDPLTYFRKAWWFIKHRGGLDVPSRGPGYPIWLIITGAAPLDIWWGLVVSQLAMAVAAPVLIYGILSPISRNAGFAAGLLFMVFAVSYQHMNWVMTEELFLFVELLSLLLISRYWAGAWPTLSPLPDNALPRARRWHRFQHWLRTPYPITLSLAYCTTVKPAGSPFFWLFIAVCVLFRVAPWKRYVGPVALYVAIMMAWATHDYFFSPVRFSPFGMPNTLVQRNFADVYYGNGFGVVNGWEPVAAPGVLPPQPTDEAHEPIKIDPQTIRRDDGPASQRLYEAVATLVANQRQTGQWNVTEPDTAYQLYGRYRSDAELVNTIFVRPNPFYYSLVVLAAAPAGGDELLRAVAREHNNSGLFAYVKYLLRHPTLPLKGPPNAYVGYHFFSKFYRYQHFFDDGFYGARDLYVAQPAQNIKFINEGNGPASRAFANSIRFFVAGFPQFLGLGPNELRELGSRENLARIIVEQQHTKYSGAVMGWVFGWLSILYGEERMGDLLGAAAVEALLRGTAPPGFLLGDFLSAAVFGGNGDYGPLRHHLSVYEFATNFRERFDAVKVQQSTVLMNTVKGGTTTQLPPRLARWVGRYHEPSELSQNIETTLAVQYGLFKWSKPILFVSMMIFALPLIVLGRGGRLVAFLVLTFFVSAAAWVVAMIMPTSDPRHEEVFAFMPLLVAVLGFASIPHFWATIRQNSAIVYSTENRSIG